MSNKKLTIGLLITLVIAVSAMFFPKVAAKLSGVSNGVDVSTTNLTSLAVSNGISNGGIFTSASRVPTLTQASTTLCAIQAPNATSTLVFATLSLTQSTTSASFIELAQATTAFATTTLVGTKYSIAANAAVTITASTSPAAGDAVIFAPNSWFVAKWVVANGAYAATNNAPAGVCQAMFRSTN